MKKLLYLMGVLVIVFGLTAPAYALSFSDNFNDGNTDGWTLNAINVNAGGNWSVVNGTLWENMGATGHMEDDCTALVSNLVFSHQIIDTKVKTNSSYGGVVFWYQDTRAQNYPLGLTFEVVLQYRDFILIMDVVSGSPTIYTIPTYSAIDIGVWHDLEVDANSNSGKVKIYIDGNLVTTYDSMLLKEERIGLTGVYAGNEGAYFDDFSVRSVPEPATMLLLGLGLMGLAGVRKRMS